MSVIISPIVAVKSEMDSQIFWLSFGLDKGSNHVCFVSRISVSFAAKRESRQLWFGLVLAQPSLFLPLLALL